MWYRRNADTSARELERRWQSGDINAGLPLLAAYKRSNERPDDYLVDAISRSLQMPLLEKALFLRDRGYASLETMVRLIRAYGYDYFHLTPCGQCGGPSWQQPCPYCRFYPMGEPRTLFLMPRAEFLRRMQRYDNFYEFYVNYLTQQQSRSGGRLPLVEYGRNLRWPSFEAVYDTFGYLECEVEDCHWPAKRTLYYPDAGYIPAPLTRCHQHDRGPLSIKEPYYRPNPYRRNADLDIRELERRWAQDRDEEAGRQLQAWKRRAEPIDLDDVAAWLLPRIDDIEVYVFAADLYCEDCGEKIQQEILEQFRRGDVRGYEDQLPEVICHNQLCGYRAPVTQATTDENGDYLCGADCNWPDVRIEVTDSDSFPAGPIKPGYASSPHHCGSQESCVNAFQIDWNLGGEPDMVSMLITEELDPYGVNYVIESATEPEATRLAHLWALVYEENYPEIRQALEVDDNDDEDGDVRDNPYDVVPGLEALRSKFCVAAQRVYDSWDQNAEGWGELVGSGGICHLVAEAIQEVLTDHGIDSTTFSFSIGDVHVTAVADVNGDAYMVDIPARLYETGGGYTWRKIPDVIFEPHDIVIEPMGEPFEDYLQEY